MPGRARRRVDRLRDEARLGLVMGEQLRLGLDHLREIALQRGGDAFMQVDPAALEERLVSSILDQGVLEGVAGRR